MLHYVQNIIPYVTATGEALRLPPTKEAFTILDVFAPHRVGTLQKTLAGAHIKFVYVPAGCTGELQLLDKSLNDCYKKQLKECFTKLYANQVKKALEKKEEVKISLQTSIIKEPHANCIYIFKLIVKWRK